MVSSPGVLAHIRDDVFDLFVAQVGDRLAGFAVDELNEPQEIVVKSLGEYVGGARGVSGASILGDGPVVLIMDIPTLISSVGVRSRIATSTEQQDLENELNEIQELRELEAAHTTEPAEDAA